MELWKQHPWVAQEMALAYGWGNSMMIYVKTEPGRALPPVFALRVSTGSPLLGNSKLLAQKMNTFPGPQECRLDQNQLLQMVTLEKTGGPQP